MTSGPSGRWARRALTIPGYLLLTPLYLCSLPVLVAITALVDFASGRRLALTRSALFLGWYLVCECAGLGAALLIWLRGGSREAFLARNVRLQCIWARMLFAGVRGLFGITVALEGEERIGEGPLLVFCRHASMADTLLPATFLADRRGLRLRWVLKREVLWDPCLDVVGHRLPNVFVRRGSGDADREVAAVRELAHDLSADEGVMIYPEGTRFSLAKQARVLAKLEADGDEEALRFASRLRHLLPPRPGGSLGLIDAAPDCDVLFMGHVGFDGIATARDLVDGRLIGREIRICYRRVSAKDIPRERQARAVWLRNEWAALDDWVELQRASGAVQPSGDRLDLAEDA